MDLTRLNKFTLSFEANDLFVELANILQSFLIRAIHIYVIYQNNIITRVTNKHKCLNTM